MINRDRDEEADGAATGLLAPDVDEAPVESSAATVDTEKSGEHQTQAPKSNNNVGTSAAVKSPLPKPKPQGSGHGGAQVAPFPRIEDFQVGKILSNSLSEALTPAARQEEEASYIPVALARTHLAKVVADMHTMKDEQALKIAQIMERYKAIEQDTQAHYESYVKEIKSKAKSKIQDEKRKYAALESASAEQRVRAELDKQQLIAEHEQEQKLHEQQRERWRESLESSLQQHEDAMARCHALVTQELARTSQVHASERDAKLAQLRNELVMCWEDAKAESGRMLAQLDQLRKELLVKEKAFLRRVQQMQSAFEIEFESLQCLNTVVNRVVDMAQQQMQRSKTKELTTQISKLESEMKDAAQRESGLQRRLAEARERFASIERAAVVDTMEFMLQTLELAPAKSPPKPLAEELPTTTTTAIQTDLPQQEELDMAMALPQVQYETQVERLRERNLEILHSKQHLKAQKAELQALLEKKNAAKTQIKAWLAAFQHEHGHEPTIEDKAQVKDLYLLFKANEEAYNSKKDAVAQLKARHHERVLEIDTITQWQALGDTLVRNSARAELVEGIDSSALSLSSSRASTASGSRPVSSSQSSRSEDSDESAVFHPPASHKDTAALEHELELLRQELVTVKRAAEKQTGAEAAGDTIDTVSRVSPEVPDEAEETESETPFGEDAGGGDYMEAPVDAEAELDDQQLNAVAAKAAPRHALEEEEKQLREAMQLAQEHEQQQLQALKQQQELVAVEMEQQRASLQTTIAQLTQEIDQRKEEKSKLEKEIEQLRLHLELMELNHDEHDIDMDMDGELRHRNQAHEGDAQSGEKSSGRRDEQVKRRASQNTFFDDEEAVESEDDDDESVGSAKSPSKAADEELLDANEDSSGDEDEDDEGGSADQESADAKDSHDASSALLDKEREEDEKKDTESPAEKDDFMSCLHLVTIIRDAVEQGKAQFNRGDKAKCYQTYQKASEKCVEELKCMHQSRREDVAGFKSALGEAARLPPARGSMILRKQLDLLLADCEKRLKDREERAAAKRKLQLERSMASAKQAADRASAAKSPAKSSTPAKKSHKKATPSDLPDLSDSSSAASPAKVSSTVGSSGASSGPMPAGGKVLEEYKQKLKALEAKAKSDRVKITQLEAALSKAEAQLSSSSGGGNSNSGGGGGGANSAVLERKVADLEKKHKHALEDAEKSLKKEIGALSQQLQAAQSKSQALQDQVAQSQKELATLGGKATQLTKLEDEMVTLKQQAAQATAFSEELTSVKSQLGKLETSYKEEQSLRKKYYNMIEDMKGKIRVYARCRPMSSSELERGCLSCVKFVDEYSLELESARGPKPFAFDQVFSPASSQDQVFEDTKNLLQSAIDGYNVCIFAYGQTGSGKTFTMTGTESMPGLSPRAITHLFALADDAKSNHTITFQAFMLELYNDNLIDLFHLVDMGHDRDSAMAAAHKLEIKKNDKGMVFVSNSTMKVCTSAQQTLKLFEAANKKRQVGSTKMNAESSRSHSVFSILVENYNKTTKATSIGKLSLVDLAGSERAGKTGATADRLKEAQAINKSLSALGDVISALSTNEKFIPYRNNKLTQLMQDSLGGNAKTLMFVNLSPADYNQEETQTSLQYASRVKLITNNANKNSESELVNRLKHIIKQLKAGKTDVELDGIIE